MTTQSNRCFAWIMVPIAIELLPRAMHLRHGKQAIMAFVEGFYLIRIGTSRSEIDGSSGQPQRDPDHSR
jgi:hypothetical protein